MGEQVGHGVQDTEEEPERRYDIDSGMSGENKVMLRAFIGFGIVSVAVFAVLVSIVQGAPPAVTGSAGPPSQHIGSTGWVSVVALIVPLALVIAVPVVIGLALYSVFVGGRDRKTFRQRQAAEQQRLVAAGDVLQHSLRTGPTVANTMTSRQGRRAGRAATREARRSRRRRTHH